MTEGLFRQVPLQSSSSLSWSARWWLSCAPDECKERQPVRKLAAVGMGKVTVGALLALVSTTE